MNVTLSIDFGTTNTLIAATDGDGKVTVFHLGRGGMQCPSTVYMQADGSLFFGDDAEDMAQTDPANYRRAFKMKLGSPAPLLGSYTAADITAKFLSHLLDQVRQDASMRGATIGSVVLTCPVNFSPAQREALRRAAVAAGLSKVELVDEPAAAGLAFCRGAGTQAFKHNALVVDWGGGTLDMALVTRGADGRVTVNSAYSYGCNDMGGEVFDDLLCEYVLGQVTLPQVVWPELNRRVRELKHRLSTCESGVFRIPAEGRMLSEPVNRGTFEQLIEEHLRVAGAAVKELLARVPADKKPEMLVLVGGSALIPCIRRELEQASGLPTHTWNEAHVAIVKGGAYWAAPVEKKKAPEKPQPKPQPESGKHQTAGEQKKTAPKPENKGTAAADIMPMHEAVAQLAARGIAREQYESALAEAIRNNSRDTIKLLILAGADISVSRFGTWLEKNDTALALLLLLRKYWNVNDTDGSGSTPLVLAAKYNRMEVLEYLLTTPVYVNKANYSGDTALCWAAVNGNLRMVKELVKVADIDINKTGSSHHTPLKLAVMKRYQEIVNFLLTLPGIDVNIADDAGRTALHEVAENGDITALKKLLSVRGINVNAADNEGRTPLYLAASKGHSNCLNILLIHGVDVNKKDKHGVTPIFEAFRSGWDESVNSLLAVPGIDVNAVDDSKHTMLHLAASANRVQMLKSILVKLNAKINEGDLIGNTPLYEAAKNGYIDCVRALLNRRDIDVNKSNDFGWTPLHLACEKGHALVVKALLNHPKIEVNKNNICGLGPISYAEGECLALMKKAGAMTLGDRWKKFWQ